MIGNTYKCELSSNDILSLDTPLHQNKILIALNSFKAYKAPGPDGLHPFFLPKILDGCR